MNLNLELKKYFPSLKENSWALRMKLSASNGELPDDKRYYLGGTNGIRGYNSSYYDEDAEELVGEISDEYDREQQELTQLGENLYRVNPRTTLSAFGEYFELEIEDEDVDTVAGLIIKLLDRLPVGGERVQAHGFDFVAERVDVKKGRLGSIVVKKIND